MVETLENKVSAYDDPRNQIDITYTNTKKPPPFLPEEDRFIVCFFYFVIFFVCVKFFSFFL